MTIGLQLWSVHKEVDALGVETVFQMISEAGFDSVEFAGFYGLTPVQMKAMLEKYNLKGVSAHINIDDILNQLEYIDVLGIKSVYIPGIKHAVLRDETATVIEKIKNIQKELLPRGVKLGYHNHAQEYEDGGDLVLKLLRGTTNFYAQLDVCWAKAAGLEPTDKMREYGDRLGCLHIKEIAEPSIPGGYLPAPLVGDGVAGMDGIFALALSMGIDTYILEVEGTEYPIQEYLTKSCERMKKYLNIN